MFYVRKGIMRCEDLPPRLGDDARRASEKQL